MNRLVKVLLLAVVLAMVAGSAWADNGTGKPQTKPESTTRGELDCTNAITIECNSTTDGDNTNSPNNVELYSCSTWNESGGEDVYMIDLDDFYDVVITISNLQADLDVFLLTDCDEALCTAYGNATITGQFGPGVFYIVVDGYNGAVSPYTLDVTCDVPEPLPEEDGSICNFISTCYEWDFNEGDHGFTPAVCDPTGAGSPVWQYGTESLIPGSPGNVWATVLNGTYVATSGEGLYSPPFTVTQECSYMEIRHYVYTEGYTTSSGNIYDGCNVTVDDIVIPPVEGYTGPVNMGSAPCVLGEDAFAGNVSDAIPIRTWGRSCFDLSQFMGMEIRVRFDFGSDSSVQRPGWYLEYVKLGTTQMPVPTVKQTWGTLKALYK